MLISYRFAIVINFKLTIVYIVHPLALVCVHNFGLSVEISLETDAERSWKCVQVDASIV